MKTYVGTETALLVVILLLALNMSQGRQLQCVCSTQHCKDTGRSTCNTEYKCYTQYLEKQGGVNPLTRGCISGNTPILCENRLPAVSRARWPYLICCDSSDLCNAMPLSTRAQWVVSSNGQYPENLTNRGNISSVIQENLNLGRGDASGRSPWSINHPVVFSIVAIGLALLVCILGLGLFILRQQSKHIQRNCPLQIRLRAAEEEPSESMSFSQDFNSPGALEKENNSKVDP